MPKTMIRLLCALLLTSAAAVAQPTQAQVSAVLNYRALQPGQQAVLAVVLDIRPGLHAQSHKPLDPNLIPFELKLEARAGVRWLDPVYPPGHIETYPSLGTLSVYTGRTVIFVPLEVEPGAAIGSLSLKGTASYQICDDKSCFPPEEARFEIATQVVPAGQPLEPNQPELFAEFDPTTFVKPVEQEPQRGLPAAFALALVVGVIFNVMPCVLPIVPLKALGFYQAAQENRARSLMLGAVFATGIIATFGALAIPVVVLKTIAWGELFGDARFVAVIVLILVAMAMGTFGLFSIVLPSKVYEVTPKHDTYVGNFLFGILTAVLSTPCTFGMFLGLLVVATRLPAALGTALVMTVGLGMSLPYLVLAAFPNLAKSFPRTGPWAETVKQLMGFLLLATAVYFGRRFLPEALRDGAFWWILFAVVAAAGVFLVVQGMRFSKTATGVIVSSIVALLLVAPTLAVTLKLSYHPIAWVKFDQQRFEQSLTSGKPVIVKFTADWCGNCQYVEGTVYTDPRTVDAIKKGDIIATKADLTRRDAPGWDLLRSLHPVGAIPFTAVYLPNEQSPHTLAGIYTTDDLLKALGGH